MFLRECVIGIDPQCLLQAVGGTFDVVAITTIAAAMVYLGSGGEGERQVVRAAGLDVGSLDEDLRPTLVESVDERRELGEVACNDYKCD